MKNLIQPSGSWFGCQAQFGSGSGCGFAFSAVALAAALAIGLPFGAHAETIIVPSGSILTIQDGVDASAPGDTIQVLPGVYNERVSVTTPRIKLQGETKTGTARVASFLIQADDVEIKGFDIGGDPRQPSVGIEVRRAAGVHVSYNYLGIFGDGIVVSSSSHVHIDHNSVGCVSSAIVVKDSSGTLVDYNGVFGEYHGILVSGSSGTHVNHNTASSSTFAICVISSSDGQIAQNTAHSIFGIFVSGDSCGNKFDHNSVHSCPFDLYSEDDPAAPCNRYNNNGADNAFPSMTFWGVK